MNEFLEPFDSHLLKQYRKLEGPNTYSRMEPSLKVLLFLPKSLGIGFTDLIRAEPLGLEMVAAALTHHDVSIVDLRLEDALESFLSREVPDACGIGCNYTIDQPAVLELARQIKQLRPGVFVFVGGHHASMCPSDFTDNSVDAVVVGEGELIVPELIDALEKSRDFSAIPGIFLPQTMHPGEIRSRSLIDSLDTLPFPKRVRKKGSRDGYHMGFQHPLALVETSRGCHFNCSFCSVWQFYHMTYRAKSPERVVEELSQIEEPFVLFVDDNFLLRVDRAQKIARLLRGEGLIKHYTFQARSDTIVRHPEVIEAWREVGLQGVFIGVEKVDDEALVGVNKNNSAENNEKAIDFLQGLGLDIWASFIVDPSFDHADFQKLKDFIVRHNLKSPTFSVLTPLPGTRLFSQLRGQLTTTDNTLYDIAHAVLPTRLPLKEFYEEFCSLYELPYSKIQLVWEGFQAWVSRGLSLRRLFTMIGAARRLATPEAYLKAHESRSPSPMQADTKT